jgi:peptide/nickel transport system permease protein
LALFRGFILPRLAQWLLVIIVGVTITFLIPRLSPVNPVDTAIGRMTSLQTINPEAVKVLRQTIQDLYGLNGTILDQYFAFWGRVLKGDLGPSFGAFPTTVNQMISNSVGWTVGLLATSLLISWLLGLVLGSLSGYFPNRWWSQGLERSLVLIYPIPYFILAFVLLIIWAYYIPLFPLIGSVPGTPSLNITYIGNVIYHSFLPALSLVIGGMSFRFIISKALTTSESSSDYVKYAEMAALPKRKILFAYVIRNTMLPQITDLGLSLGSIFEGALLTEVVFGYPGMGYLLVNAINAGDYNLLMGINLLAIVGVATASMLVDLSYPLFDPRVRYR